MAYASYIHWMYLIVQHNESISHVVQHNGNIRWRMLAACASMRTKLQYGVPHCMNVVQGQHAWEVKYAHARIYLYSTDANTRLCKPREQVEFERVGLVRESNMQLLINAFTGYIRMSIYIGTVFRSQKGSVLVLNYLTIILLYHRLPHFFIST